jgi:formylglycine-generating enzyme required for sulfatase activity
MGSLSGRPDERPVLRVRLSQPFYLSMYEVTRSQWQALMDSSPAQSVSVSSDLPVASVSWQDIQTFIARLNTREQSVATYRLPTEAEWEYAARAGAPTVAHEGHSPLDTVAWCGPNAGNQPHPIGQLAPNAWGLYDMQGNVAEWVQDWYRAPYPPPTGPAVVDPQGASHGTERVVRGGSWYDPAGECRVTARQHAPPGERHPKRGFRLLRIPSRP